LFKIAYSSVYHHPLPQGHRFPMEKYTLIPQQLIHEGVIQSENLFEPSPISEDVLLLTHEWPYIQKLNNLALSRDEVRRIGFPLSRELVNREYIITHGTLKSSLFALEYGVSANVAGGTHHAYSDKGEGFCLFNDFAVAANFLIQKNYCKRILIIDLDVHQGNGTAAIFGQNSNVFTFSMHGKNNYPLHKEKSDFDVELEDGTTDVQYLNFLHQFIPGIIESFEPDFAFYLSGVDILQSDKLGRLAISPEACLKRDEMVLSTLYQSKIPVCMAMGGGYSPEIKTIVDAHCNTFKVAKEIWF
jgi:acetoin utilization deacetylase AcuC-like enzyme